MGRVVCFHSAIDSQFKTNATMQGTTTFGGEQVRAFEYVLTVSEATLQISLVDVETRDEWQSTPLQICDFTSEHSKIPGATTQDYAHLIAECLAMSSSESRTLLEGDGPEMFTLSVEQSLHVGCYATIFVFEFQLVRTARAPLSESEVQQLLAENRQLKKRLRELTDQPTVITKCARVALVGDATESPNEADGNDGGVEDSSGEGAEAGGGVEADGGAVEDQGKGNVYIAIDLGAQKPTAVLWRDGKLKTFEIDTSNERGLNSRAAQFRQVYDIQKLIGRQFSDPIVQEGLERWPFQIVATVDDDFYVTMIDHRGVQVSQHPDRIAMNMVNDLIKSAEVRTGEAFKRVEFLTPQFWDRDQHKAWKTANKLSSIDYFTLSEVDAARLSYAHYYTGRTEAKEMKPVLLVILGDTVSHLVLVKYEDGAVKAVTTRCMTDVSLNIVDDRIAQHFATKFSTPMTRELRAAAKALRSDLCVKSPASYSISILGRNRDIKLSSPQLSGLIQDMCTSLKDNVQAVQSRSGSDPDLIVCGELSRVGCIWKAMRSLKRGHVRVAEERDNFVRCGAAISAAIPGGKFSSAVYRTFSRILEEVGEGKFRY